MVNPHSGLPVGTAPTHMAAGHVFLFVTAFVSIAYMRYRRGVLTARPP